MPVGFLTKPSRLRWDSVRYEPGEVRVVAYRNGKPWAENRIETAGKAAFVELTVDRTTVQAGSEDLFFVTAKLTDRRGRFVPQAADRLDFSVEGPARIVATDNGDPTSHASFQSPSVNAFNAVIIVSSVTGSLPINIELSAFTDR